MEKQLLLLTKEEKFEFPLTTTYKTLYKKKYINLRINNFEIIKETSKSLRRPLNQSVLLR